MIRRNLKAAKSGAMVGYTLGKVTQLGVLFLILYVIFRVAKCAFAN